MNEKPGPRVSRPGFKSQTLLAIPSYSRCNPFLPLASSLLHAHTHHFLRLANGAQAVNPRLVQAIQTEALGGGLGGHQQELELVAGRAARAGQAVDLVVAQVAQVGRVCVCVGDDGGRGQAAGRLALAAAARLAAVAREVDGRDGCGGPPSAALRAGWRRRGWRRQLSGRRIGRVAPNSQGARVRSTMGKKRVDL